MNSGTNIAQRFSTEDLRARLRRVLADINRLAIDTQWLEKTKQQTLARVERILGGLALLRCQFRQAGIEIDKCVPFDEDPMLFFVQQANLLTVIEKNYIARRVAGLRGQLQDAVNSLYGGVKPAIHPDRLMALTAKVEHLSLELRDEGYQVPPSLGDDIVGFLQDWLEYLNGLRGYEMADASQRPGTDGGTIN